MSSLSDKVIVASRTDGLGGRLLAMVNAICLAKKIGCRYGFTWNRREVADKAFHVVDIAEEIFSAEFIDRHWIGEEVDETGFDKLGPIPFSLQELNRAARRQGFKGWICNHFSILRSFRVGPALSSVSREEVAVAAAAGFQQIGFSERVQDALDAAGGRKFARPMAALHLRSGDIVFGTFRTRLHFAQKVIPSALAKAVVSELSSRGMDTLLIGQDRATLDYLKSATGAFSTDDFGASRFQDPTLRAFFEMALMARCQRIYAGASVFARMASVIGSVPKDDTDKLFGKRRAADLILEELNAHEADYHPLESAFGYQWAFLSLEGQIGSLEATEILGKAYALDPENPVYPLKIAAIHFRQAEYQAGEAILRSLLEGEFDALRQRPFKSMRVLTATTKVRGHALKKDFDDFIAAGRAGHPYAAACAAHIFSVLGDTESAIRMADRALEAETGSRLFEKIRRRLEPDATKSREGGLPA